MNVLVVYAHPCPESFNAAVKDKVVTTLEAAGHLVRVADLYAEGFQPAMDAAERRRYHDAGENEHGVTREIERIKWAQALVFVYPTWWFGLPAMLKGWLDRSFVPHMAFAMPPESESLSGKLDHIRVVGVVTTCGANWMVSKLMGEPGRKMLVRGIRGLCARQCRTFYCALYKMDTVSEGERRRYLNEIARTLTRSLGH
ncbi:NAD(P)H-dependent oxidoreductase [Amorphus sp. 3PC139-8]|uniref:NAD(P)H-dependent oxidoreductase n=1 Tax=Amorphus sp. 3PC139-8 TaxID=2735676 RepID=UPI00345C990F